MNQTLPGSEASFCETILIVEDDRALREGLEMNLKHQGYTIITASDGEQGMQRAFDARPDLIILDFDRDFS